ncbi:hypothetical protein [Inconstantimicrobium mannanitabidum]|uniref:Uncharacterized protein n=1 Tax=Inconstantimicrobium mannanitabidum TaxID=1604901 RepID=A0ACB5RAV4_9CLOT|nr:hypothetical protein [Clostridium sp. TW13]GKX66133.1 hypothetical protein rsdtw13_13910 [Clostridium sp. TW13]
MKKLLKIGSIVLIAFVFMGCNKEQKKNKVVNHNSAINVPQYILQRNIDGKISTFQWDNNQLINLSETPYGKNTILFYKNKIVESLNEDHINIKKGDLNINLEDNVIFTKINQSGDKIFYKVLNGDIYTYYYLDLNSMRKQEIKIDLSADLIEWTEDDNLIFYGVSNKKTGIFTYNINDNQINKIIDIKEGYVNYLHMNGDEIIYLFNGFTEGSDIKVFNMKTNKTSTNTVHFKVIKDLKVYEDSLIIKSTEEDKGNIYVIRKGEVNKINYEFPEEIENDSYLLQSGSKTLFVGKSQGAEGLYSYDIKNNEIKLEIDLEGENYIPNT